MKNETAEIVLKSDLCAGSGYSYAGLVDTDVCYTDYGIPYIPSRRLKGCLREAALMIGIDSAIIDRLFGISGNDESGLLRIDNAYIKDNNIYEEQIDTLNSCTDRKYFDVNSVLNQFTNIRALTAIDSESGTTLENSLRFVRVVNHYGFEKGNENVFFSEIEYPEEYEKQVSRIFKALRNIGLDRNRGLGSVSCRLIDGLAVNGSFKIQEREYDKDKDYIISYSIRNTQPLMLSNDNAGESETYISGQSVLGFFAGKFKDSEVFDDIALNGKTVFSNLYPAHVLRSEDKELAKRMIPVPAYINYLKKTKDIVNILISDPENRAKDGNQPKKFKNYYCCFTDKSMINLFQPELDIVYHHTKKSNENPDGLLYSLIKVKRGQIFSGFIVAKGYLIRPLLDVLRENDLYFGKSKSAQYGKCVVEHAYVRDYAVNYREYKAGEKIVITLNSDGIFINDDACYTIDPNEVKSIMATQLGFSYVKQHNDFEKQNRAFDQASTKYITGYNSKWNLKKPSFSAIRAGSTFVYELKEDAKIADGFIGEKNLEGFGEYIIRRLCDMDILLKENKEKDITGDQFPDRVKDELAAVVLKQLYTDLLDQAIRNSRNLNISSSLLGRVALMVKQSDDKNDLMNRIASIKSDASRNRIMAYIERAIGKKNDPLCLNFSDTEEYDLLKKMNRDDDYINRGWKNYLLRLLTQEKYLQKDSEEGGNDDE